MVNKKTVKKKIIKNVREILNPKLSGFGIPSPNVVIQKKKSKTKYKDRKKVQQVVYEKFKTDPLVGIIVNMTVFFVFGRGIDFNFNTEEYNKFVKQLWRKNKMPILQKTMGIEGEIYGEVFIKLIIHRQDEGRWKKGEVEIVLIDPAFVEIQPSETNASEPTCYIVSFDTDISGKNITTHYLDFWDFDISSETQKIEIEKDFLGNKINLSNDECIYHLKFNSVSNDIHGWSDIIRILEWIDEYEEYLRDAAIINKLYRSPFMDIEVESDGSVDECGNDIAVMNAMRRYESWSAGCNVVHNQKEKWSVKEFQTKSVSDDGRRGLLLIVAAGVGFPEYMLSDGSNANLATARTQQLPAIKRFADKQDSYEFVFSLILEFIIKVAVENNLVVKHQDNTEYIPEVKFPAIIEADDKTETDTTIDELTNGIISLKTARGILGRNDDYENRQIISELKNGILKDELKNGSLLNSEFSRNKELIVELEEVIDNQMKQLSKEVIQKREVITTT